ncbi:MAG TPA: hypothetical protein VL490_01230 [Mucilaginibacter sp.]|nr:hypothetical protein [Mucilaginibacter sp.]
MAILAIPAYVVIRFLLSKFDSGINSETTLFSFNLPSAKQSVIMLIVFLLFSLYLPIKIFMIWHSLAPPQDTGLVGANNLSLVPWYGVLAFCYCGLATLILAPDWFIINKRMLIISTVIAFVFLIINLLQGYFLFAPFMTAAKRFLSLSSFNIYQKTIPAFIFLFAFNFLLSSLVRLWQNRYNPVFMFIALTALLIAFSSIKVKAQFSSRYVGQIVPLFLLLFIPFEKTSWVKVIRISVGVCLGFISLYFYYFGG